MIQLVSCGGRAPGLLPCCRSIGLPKASLSFIILHSFGGVGVAISAFIIFWACAHAPIIFCSAIFIIYIIFVTPFIFCKVYFAIIYFIIFSLFIFCKAISIVYLFIFLIFTFCEATFIIFIFYRVPYPSFLSAAIAFLPYAYPPCPCFPSSFRQPRSRTARPPNRPAAHRAQPWRQSPGRPRGAAGPPRRPR
jgi:hypothetical protein